MLVDERDYAALSWNKLNAAVVTNGIPTPDGDLSQRVHETGDIRWHGVEQYCYRYALVAISYRACVVAKAGERTRLVVNVGDKDVDSSGVYACFDLASGVFVGVDVQGADWSAGVSSISSLGNGWYRCCIDAVCPASLARVRLQALLDAGSGSQPMNFYYTGDNASGLFLGKSSLLPSDLWSLGRRSFFDDFLSASTIDLGDKRTSGFNWYRHNTWPRAGSGWNSSPATPRNSISVKKSVLTIDADVSGFGESLNTAAVSPTADDQFVGTVFSPPALFEASLAFDPVFSNGFNKSWPAFWSISIEALLASTAGSILELDHMEAAPYGGLPHVAQVLATIHDWTQTTHYSRNSQAYWGSPDFTKQHVYSQLWLPQRGNLGGLKMCFFDGIAVSASDVGWSSAADSSPPTGGPPGTFSAGDTQRLTVILGAGSPLWPIHVDYVAVYQP